MRNLKNRTKVAIIIAVALVTFTGTSMILAGVLGNVGPAKDSGVAACQEIGKKYAEGKSSNTNNSGDATITEAQYKQLRGVFAHSRYGDLRDAGTKFVDLVWQLSKLGDDAGFAAFGMIGTLYQDYASLAGACAAHGSPIPSLNASP